MLRPIPSKSAAILAKQREETQPLESNETVSENAEKLKLATALHAQGINPERWTEARPAGWATQKAFRETGRKPDAQHFEVDGRLYKTDPRVAATQAQGQDAIDVYLGAAPKPVEQLVDIAKVPLKYPFGRPHEARDDRPDAHALNLHYARVGVDPGSAHNGDPLPMASQPKLQQATRAPDGSEIPLGIPGIYRGYDDGYFYAANEGTVESPDVQALRRKLAAEKATARGDVTLMVANDNDPEIDEAVARSYAKQAPTTPAAESVAAGNTLAQQSAEAAGRLPQLISAIGKLQTGESLTADDSDLLARTEAAFAKAGIPIDLKKVDVENLKRAAAASVDDAATVAKGPMTPVEAYVERDFGMSPNIPRTNLIPDPRGADGMPTWDVSQWTAPQVLYDLVRAIETPTVIMDGHPISQEELQNLALAMVGGGALRGAATREVPEILASRRAKLYNGPVTERPFSMDYPNVEGRHDAVGNLTHDIDGNPLEVGGRIVGRSVVGGADQALPAAQFDGIAKEGTGRGTKVIPPGGEGLGRNVGAVPYDRHTRLPKEVILSNKITGADLPGVYGHEIGHVIDQLAGEIPVEGLTKELKALYDVGNNPNRARGNPDMPGNWGRRYRPEDAGYKGEDIPREWMAEAIRIYMANPSYMKEVAPKTAAAIRKAVNADPAIRKIIQFNMGGAPLPPVSPPDSNVDTDINPLLLPPDSVLGKIV